MANEGMRLRVSGPGAPWVAFSNSFPEFLRTSPFLRFPSLLSWKVGRCSAVTTPIPPAGWGGVGGVGGVPWPCPCQTPGLCQVWPGPAQLFLPRWANYFLNFLSSSISIFTLILWGCYFN